MSRQRSSTPSTGTVGQPKAPDEPAISNRSTVEALLQLADKTGEDELGGVISSLREQGEQCVAVVRSAVTSGDSSAVITVTHGLIGSAGAMGAATLEALSRRICEGARQGDLQMATSLAEQLQSEFERTLGELAAHHRRWSRKQLAG